MKKLKTSFLFFCKLFFYVVAFNSFSQQETDSLAFYYKKSNDTTSTFRSKLIEINKLISLSDKLNNDDYLLIGYNRKSYLYFKLKKYDSAIIVANQLLDKGIFLKDTTRLLFAYKKLADYNRVKNNFSFSFKYYTKHKELSFLIKDTLFIIKDLRYIASIQKTLGFIHESEVTTVDALKLANQLKINTKKVIKIKIGLYNQLGILYNEINKHDKALELYDKALFIAKKQSDINTILNNRANVYLKQKKFNLAIGEFTNLYHKNLELKNNIKIAQALNNLGNAQSKINHPNALLNMLKALRIRVKEKSTFGMYSSYIHLAEYYSINDENKKVKYYALKAYDIAKNINSSSDRVEALSHLVQINDDKKIVEYKILNDSISRARQINANKYASMKYDYSEKEKQLQEKEIILKNSKIKEAKERYYKVIYQTIGIIILIIGLFTYFILKSKNKKEKLQQVYITETRISQKVHDEVANDIFGVMTKLQVNEQKNAVILDDLERVYIKTRDISKENSVIDFTENFGEVLQDLLMNYQNKTVNVITRNLNKMDWESVSKLKKTVIYRVLQELMTNMKKHSEATITVISFEEKNKKLHINYRDNGIGCTLNKNTGLQNTENRIQSVNGSITFESQTNKGFDVKMTI